MTSSLAVGVSSVVSFSGHNVVVKVFKELMKKNTETFEPVQRRALETNHQAQ